MLDIMNLCVGRYFYLAFVYIRMNGWSFIFAMVSISLFGTIEAMAEVLASLVLM
jgi:hypothetical protein